MRYALLFFLVLTQSVYAQFRSTEGDFVRYLLNSKLYTEASVVIQEKLQYTNSNAERDSLNFLLGKTYYDLQKLSLSNKFLSRVSWENSRLFNEATYLHAYNNVFLGSYDSAKFLLQNSILDQSEFKFLKAFELAGVSLLQNDLDGFDSLKVHFDQTKLEVRQSQENFLIYRKDIEQLKTRSPFLAGTLSAIIPGLGRVYSKKKATGIYSFIAGTLLGLQVVEAYRKSGVESPRFILYSSLFSVFYIGNIWGSAISVKVARNEKYEAIRHQVLVDMHIPLRAVFK